MEAATQPSKAIYRATLLVAAIAGFGGASLVAALALANTEDDARSYGLLFTGFVLTPYLGLALLAYLTRNGSRARQLVVLIGGLLAAAITVIGAVSFVTSESSTASLIIVVAPVYQWIVITLTAGLCLVLHLLGRRDRPGAR